MHCMPVQTCGCVKWHLTLDTNMRKLVANLTAPARFCSQEENSAIFDYVPAYKQLLLVFRSSGEKRVCVVFLAAMGAYYFSDYSDIYY